MSMEDQVEKAKALSVVSEAMRFVLLDAGIHVNKGNMRKELPMDDIDWENYKYHFKSIKPNKEEFWIVVGQLIFIRDKTGRKPCLMKILKKRIDCK